jgi:Ca2+-binding RTX toxin-like protein
VANAGGPYTINEGSSLTLNGSASSDPDGDPLTYSWDINGNNIFGDATGVNPTLSWAQLISLGIVDGNSTSIYNVKVRVDDGHGHVVDSPATTLTVLNVAPTASAGGPYTVTEGLNLSIAATASDPAGPNDPLSYSWDLNGDGVFGDGGITTASAVVTWATLRNLGIDHGGQQITNVRVRVDDGDGGVTVSAPTTLTVANVVPTISSVGGPYSVTEGQSLTVTCTASDPGSPPEVLTYSWDLNGDAIYTDAVSTSGSITLTWAQLNAIAQNPINDGPRTYTVRVKVSDGIGTNTSMSTTLTVVNAAPSVSAAASTANWVRGDETNSLLLTASDPSAVDQAASFSYAIDWDGDNVVDQTVVGPASTAVGHTFTAAGTYNVKVTATDKDGGTSSTFTLPITVSAYAVVFDSGTGKNNLIWGGTTAADTVSFSNPSANTIRVYNGSPLDIGGVDGKLIVWGQDGDDNLTLQALTQAVELHGGAGNDLVIAQNCAATLTLHGDDGDDVLAAFGSQAAVSMYGDAGSDGLAIDSFQGSQALLYGGAGDDQAFVFGATSGTIELHGGDGADLLAVTGPATGSTLRLYGEADDDRLLVTDPSFTNGALLDGGDGADVIVPGGGVNTVLGGAGDDIVIATGTDGDLIDGGAGNDALAGGPGADTINGGAGNDLILGGFDVTAGADSLNGGDDDDLIIRQLGDATILGVATLSGGTGRDVLIAGTLNLADPENDIGALIAEWFSSRTFDQKVADLNGSTGGTGDNGTVYLQVGSTVFDNAAVDQVFGGPDGDWLLYTFAQDLAGDVDGSDQTTDINL